jgi:hypothetical protein
MWKQLLALWIAAQLALISSAPAQSSRPGDPFTPAQDDPFAQMEVLTRAMEIIRQNYVEADKVTYGDLIEGALEGMLRKLDPHCEFMGRSLARCQWARATLEQPFRDRGLGCRGGPGRLATPLPWHSRALGRWLCVSAFRQICPQKSACDGSRFTLNGVS